MKKNPFILLVLLATLGTAGSQDLRARQAVQLANLAIPESLGKVESRFVGSSDRWVIHIQDVHAHLTAQENIAAIIDHLNAVYGIRTAALEGGWGSQSFPKTWALPSSREKQQIAYLLLEEDYLNGAGYAALFTPTPLRLIGIEDEARYRANRQSYLDHITLRSEIETQLQRADQNLTQAKHRTFNSDLLAFDAKLRPFREHKNAEEFLPELITSLSEADIGVGDLTQVKLFAQILALESTLDKDKLKAEAGRLMKKFRSGRLTFEELLRSGEISDDALAYYPATRTFKELLALQDQLVPLEFFHQIEEAIRRVKAFLYTSEAERALDAKSDRFFLAQKIILFHATPDDLRAYEAVQSELRADMAAFGLLDALDLALEFYEVAKERDEIFFDKITGDERLAKNIIVVTGGFHTEGLSQQLRAAGISHVVITPDLGKQMPDEAAYFKRLQDPLPQTQTLAAFLRFLEESADPRFAFAIEQVRLNAIRDLRVAAQLAMNPGTEVPSRALEEGVRPIPEPIDFASLSRPKQKRFVGEMFDRLEEGKSQAWVVAANLYDMMEREDPGVANVFLTALLENPSNKLVAIFQNPEELPTTVLGQPNVRPFRGSIDALFQRNVFRKAAEAGKIQVVANNYENSELGLLGLPERLVSLLVAYDLVRAGIRVDRNDAATFDLIQNLLREVLVDRGLLTAA